MSKIDGIKRLKTSVERLVSTIGDAQQRASNGQFGSGGGKTTARQTSSSGATTMGRLNGMFPKGVPANVKSAHAEQAKSGKPMKQVHGPVSGAKANTSEGKAYNAAVEKHGDHEKALHEAASSMYKANPAQSRADHHDKVKAAIGSGNPAK